MSFFPATTAVQPPSETELQSAARTLVAARQWGFQNDAQGRRLINALMEMARLRHQQGDSGRAQSLIREARERFVELQEPAPDLGWKVCFSAGMFHQAHGRDVQALENFQQALSYAPDGRVRAEEVNECHRSLAGCSERLGDPLHAAEYAGMTTSPTARPGPQIFHLADGRGQQREWQVTCHLPSEMLPA
jgi:tetratricopeptide (TPR) repeat protein